MGIEGKKRFILNSDEDVSNNEKREAIATWTRRAIFQFFFMSFLSLYFWGLLRLHLSTLDYFRPARDNSDILNPGLSFRPSPPDPYSTLIHFTHGYGSDSWKPLIQSIRSFVKPYSHGKAPGATKRCKWNTTLTKDFRCHVSKRKWIDWSTDTGCQKESKWRKYCHGLGPEIESRCPRLRMVWVSCEGDTAADKEYMGPIKYTPMKGIPGFFFPYLNQQNYISPVVWIQFRDLTPGVVVSVSCKMWAKNIKHDPRNPRVGGVRFELLMD